MSLVSNNIKYLRKLNGMTQEQFARRIGIKRSLLGAYEEARANPNWNALTAIAKLCNTTIDNLLKTDLQKLRATPELSMPLLTDGPVQRASGIPIPVLREPGDGLFGNPAPRDVAGLHPAEPHRRTGSPTERGPTERGPLLDEHTDAPKPLADVLDKYYRPPVAPVPDVVERPAAPLPAATTFAPYPAPQSTPGVATGTPDRPITTTFNNRYEPTTLPGRAEGGPAERSEPQPTDRHVGAPAPTGPGHADGPAISYVYQTQFGEYRQRYQQPDYLSRLPVMRLPTLNDGYYRAFEADADFAFPGAWLIGQFVRNWFDIADGRLYVLLHQQMGLLCRRVFNQVKTKGSLLLTADRSSVPGHAWPSREVALNDMLEVWEVKAFLSHQLPAPPANVDRIRQLTDELRHEVDRLT